VAWVSRWSVFSSGVWRGAVVGPSSVAVCGVGQSLALQHASGPYNVDCNVAC
jgi:hypothetical protein